MIKEEKNVVKYPEIEVELLGTDGNAFALIGAVQKALKEAEVSKEEINEFFDEATNGDYTHLLRTCMTWVNVY